MAGIVLSPMALGVINLTGSDAATRTHKIGVRLATQPTGVVTVALSSTTAGAAITGLEEFTTTNWDQDQVADVVIDEVTPASLIAEAGAKATFEATGSNYDKVTADLTYTGGFFTNSAPTGLKATAGKGTVTIEWKKPATNRSIARYIVQARAGSGELAAVTGNTVDDMDGPTYTQNLSQTSYSFNVIPGDVYSCMVTVVYVATATLTTDLYQGAAADVTTSAVVT